MVAGKHAFWIALIGTIIVFSGGMLLGYVLETTRSANAERIILSSEINLLDEQVRSREIQQLNISCTVAEEETFSFADRIYKDAIKLESYDSTSKFVDDFKTIHKRYDLLRTMLWTDSAQLRQRCKSDFHSVVYIYEYAPDTVDKRARQSAMSNMLSDLKEQYGSEILLIPIAGNMNLSSVESIKKEYKINSLPAIIIDESVVVREDTITKAELEDLIFRRN